MSDRSDERTDRRTLLAAGAAALSGLALGSGADGGGQGMGNGDGATGTADCPRPAADGPNADYFPNAVVTTHEGRRALFYDDLLAGRTVMIHCMSIAHDAHYPVIANLVRVQRLLGDQVGRDVHMYSLSVDRRDTPRALAQFAQRHGVGPGWHFLTAEPEVAGRLRTLLYAHGGGHVHPAGSVHGGHGGHDDPGRDERSRDCSLGLVRYGNEAIGLWGAVPAKADPHWIARRLSWVIPREPADRPSRRRGPHPHTYRT